MKLCNRVLFGSDSWNVAYGEMSSDVSVHKVPSDIYLPKQIKGKFCHLYKNMCDFFEITIVMRVKIIKEMRSHNYLEFYRCSLVMELCVL